jgi:flagellin
MSSILTNNGAMVALQTLRKINTGMATTQNQISTGMKVATAKDSASIWGVASTMRSDVAGLKSVSEALTLGSTTVGVARAAAESVVDLLTQQKELVLAGGDLTNEETRNKLAADLNRIGAQIENIVDAAAFNGINLLNGAAPVTDINILSSIARDDTNTVTAQSINFDITDLDGDGLDSDFTALNSFGDGVWDEGDFAEFSDLETALESIEEDLTTAINVAASFGSIASQIEIQSKFVDAFKSEIERGIGALVDADMEEASARLQALQVQQQLGIQALSIANQQPQNILALFR